ncbi:transcription factor GTE8-like protein [Corchorus olitorius]|uniref:Transcription factor GTE8-like protein n=1 Tax=Corchorus olitorius TaxID=93759 RepID=A0A1R3JFT5_9ROSI|nr:transcription factor GTE8-like protein [Corchorus olitorius]
MPTMVPRKPYERHLMMIQTQLLLSSASDHDKAVKPKLPPTVIQLSAKRAARAAVLKYRFSDLILKAKGVKLLDYEGKKPKQAMEIIDQKGGCFKGRRNFESEGGEDETHSYF